MTVFTTGPGGIDADHHPGVGLICQDGGRAFDEVLECAINTTPDTSWGLRVSKGDVVYIARADRMWSERTIAVTFEEVP